MFHTEYKQTLDKTQRYVIILLLQLIKDPNTELLLYPQKDQYFIHTKEHGVLMIGEITYPNQVTLINHKYNYSVRLCERAGEIFKTHFLAAIKHRRESLKSQYLSNTENSLKAFYNNLQYAHSR